METLPLGLPIRISERVQSDYTLIHDPDTNRIFTINITQSHLIAIRNLLILTIALVLPVGISERVRVDAV